MSVVALLVVIAVGAALASAAPPQMPTTYDVSTSTDTVIKVDARCDYSVLDSGDSAPFIVEVRDRRYIPIDGACVQVQVVGIGSVNSTNAMTDSDGKAAFTFSAAMSQRESETWLVITVTKDGYTGGYTNLEMTTVPQQRMQEPKDFWYAIAGVVSIGLVLSAEAGRYGITRLVFPLYTRLKRDEVLDHFVRGQIYGFIVSNPGEHYSMIKDSLNVNNGTLSHHLRTLEVQGFIKSRRDGTYRRFYPVKMSIPQGEGQKLSDLQIGILDIVRQTGADGASQRFIADMLDASQQTVSYNLRALCRTGSVRIEHDGRRTRYYVINN
jgi:predicted transcriptional regulator